MCLSDKLMKQNVTVDDSISPVCDVKLKLDTDRAYSPFIATCNAVAAPSMYEYVSVTWSNGLQNYLYGMASDLDYQAS